MKRLNTKESAKRTPERLTGAVSLDIKAESSIVATHKLVNFIATQKYRTGHISPEILLSSLVPKHIDEATP
jgi:hypothetical protein